MTDLIIRKVEPGDIDQVVQLCRLHAEYEGTAYNKTGKADKLVEAFFSDNPVVHCFVAIRSEKLVGYATATKEFSTWDADYYLHMDCLYLIDEARGTGIVGQFINVLKILARKNRCTHIQWQTPVDNEKAIAFYYKQQAISKDKKRFTWQSDFTV